ncbi:hypothetical protein CAPTEDRAFT_159764 [Capitella teleta]|uniref:Protein-lysine N-trimethyltransferase SMYD5 n=1 Tax=Capitella teleta TaxID=283909 RepID=R7UTA1_CAPTE|nr:hypothetical protein CAPTEDRAFT_159764 [Capitella teleta]|eukprot:ELU09739.1 hypothetical protein CAPTEDRAFT_159764 [Capitella teleta]
MRALETAQEACRRLTGNACLELPHPDCCAVKKELHTTCPHCQVEYCSEDCREAAWLSHHQVLCLGSSRDDAEHPLNRMADFWRNVHYPPETCNIMLVARMVASIQQVPAQNPNELISRFHQFCRATVNEEEEIAHKLLGEQFKDQINTLCMMGNEAGLCKEQVQQWFSPEGFRSLVALIGTNGQGIGTSSLSVWVKNCEDLDLPEDEKRQLDAAIDRLYEDIDKLSGDFINCEGSGLYLLQSTCNHSCMPNAEITFPHNNSTLAVKALSNIKTGEEICISYLDECALERSRHSRHKILRENYLFNCNCSKCESQLDEADVTSEEEMEDEEDEIDESMG